MATAAHAQFSTYLNGQISPLALAIAADLRAAGAAPPADIERRLAAWLGALADGSGGAGLPLPIDIDASTGRQVSAAAMRSYRRHLLEAGLSALDGGVPGASAGLRALLALIDELALRQAEQGERQAVDQSQRLERIVSATPLSIIEFDTQGIVRLWNPGAQRIFGWSAEEAIGRNVIRLLVPDLALEHVEMVVQQLMSGTANTSRNENVTKDGRTITCQWYNTVLRDASGAVVGVLSQTQDVTEEVTREASLVASERERARLQEEVIAAQQAALRELSTPLIPLADGLVIMPLIGSIDSSRAQQVIETLLSGVSANHARLAILDITGVPVVDTQVAAALLRAAQAVKLLGAQVVLTGIRPEIAQTLVGLGVDLTGIMTRGSLQSGIALALGREQVAATSWR